MLATVCVCEKHLDIYDEIGHKVCQGSFLEPMIESIRNML
jgi:hypothetical protein